MCNIKFQIDDYKPHNKSILENDYLRISYFLRHCLRLTHFTLYLQFLRKSLRLTHHFFVY